MKRFILIIIISILYGCISKGQNIANYNKLSGLGAGIDFAQQDFIYQKVKRFPDNTEISIAIIQNGKPSFYGVNRLKDSIVATENNTKVFEIGSISKVFTSILLANFVLEDKLKLDDAINDYIELPIKGGKVFSFKQLANHTSGLNRLPSNLQETITDQNNPYQNYDNVKLEDYLENKFFLSQKTGEKYQY